MNIDKKEWNNFILQNSGSFLQFFEWGEFQERFGKAELSSGRRVIRLADFEAVEPWCAQFIEMPVPHTDKKYWHCARGPVISRKLQVTSYKLQTEIQNLINAVKESAPKDIIFFRIEPEWEIGRGAEEELKSAGFKKLHYDVEPAQTLILDIAKSEEEILALMHEKWRYNIRLAERKGVQIKIIGAGDADFDKYFEAFFKLVDEGTSERKNINHHPKKYYRMQLEMRGAHSLESPLEGGNNSENQSPLGRGVRGDVDARLFIAEYENQVIAANIVLFFGCRAPLETASLTGRATYLHGATDNNFRNLMAPHLLQWRQIQEAKKRGLAEYDFWGIVNEQTIDKRGSSWQGFTRFKKGFGGQEVNYAGCWDYPLDKKWYLLYRLAQKFRR